LHAAQYGGYLIALELLVVNGIQVLFLG
jgi:hypothetical protein